MRFILFGCIWDHLVCLTKLGAKWAELVQKFVPRSRVGIFRNEHAWSTPLDPKLMFWCVSYHLGPFGCLTKHDAKRAELVQKFVPRSRVGIFHNKGTRSTPLDRKMMFWYISYYLGAFGTVWLRYENRCKKGRTSAKVCATKSRRNFSQRTYRVHPIRPQTEVLVRFILFGCILDSMVALRNSVQNGPNKCKSSCHEVVSEFFATNMPIHPIGP